MKSPACGCARPNSCSGMASRFARRWPRKVIFLPLSQVSPCKNKKRAPWFSVMLTLSCKLLQIIGKYAKNKFVANLDVRFNFTFNLEHCSYLPNHPVKCIIFLRPPLSMTKYLIGMLGYCTKHTNTVLVQRVPLPQGSCTHRNIVDLNNCTSFWKDCISKRLISISVQYQL